ncbi:protein containing DUF1703 [Candidatus Magnetomorum sp. HK-1]|nr:protein containing DUF1703 [Candidatus Magnetomorum sp. HK-1]
MGIIKLYHNDDLLAYLNVTDYYITQSEQEMNKGFSDIYLEPFLARYPDLKYSYLIELKYISRKEYSEAIQQEKIKKAKKQLNQYAASERVKKSVGNTQIANPSCCSIQGESIIPGFSGQWAMGSNLDL